MTVQLQPDLFGLWNATHSGCSVTPGVQAGVTLAGVLRLQSARTVEPATWCLLLVREDMSCLVRWESASRLVAILDGVAILQREKCRA